MSGQRHPKRSLLGALAELLRRTKLSLYQPRPEPPAERQNVLIQLAPPPIDQSRTAKVIPFPYRIDVPGPAKAASPSQTGIR